MRKVKWGVLGVAKIAVEKVIPAMQQGEASHIAAIASRDPGKARAAADKLGIERAFGSYEELLADREIEAVYNPLPNELHVPWTLRALAAGKHVLCEKPIALDADEARSLIEARDRSGKLVAEAFMIRYHPQWRRAKELVEPGPSGELRAIQTFFSYRLLDPDNVRNQPAGRRRALRYRLLRHPVGAIHLRRRADARRGDDRPRPELPHRPVGRRRFSNFPAGAIRLSPSAPRSRRISGSRSWAKRDGSRS